MDTNIEPDGQSPADRLERMKSEFLTARQRRLDRSLHPASGDGEAASARDDAKLRDEAVNRLADLQRTILQE